MAWNPNIKRVDENAHREFLRMAYSHAWSSPDPVTRTGAVIVDSGLTDVLGFGANHLPRGVESDKAKLDDRKWKYEHMIHAEPAALFRAAKYGKPVNEAVMYVPWVPCTPCSTAIIDSGISKIICHKDLIAKTPERWWKSTGYALELLEKCGVKVCAYEGEIGGVENLFDGVLWRP